MPTLPLVPARPLLLLPSLRASLCALAIAAGPACGDDEPPAEDGATETEAPGTTAAPSTTTDTPVDTTRGLDSSSGPTTGEPGDDTTTGDTGDDTGEPDHALGSTPNVLCEAAVAELQLIIDENATGAPDLAAVTAAYLGEDGSGTALQELVQTWGGRLGRVEDGVLVDETAILDALEAGTPADLVDVETRVYLVVSLLIRSRIDEVATAQPDADRPPELLYAAWDDAYCWYDAVVRPHAQAADALARELEGTEADMQGGFEWGHGGIESEAASFAIDEWSVPAAKQVTEKTLFRVYDRLVVDLATRAQAEDDPLLARRALGLFALLEDRMAGRNTPGIAIIQADLAGDPAIIDPGSIRRELDVAWAKRTRRYSDLALLEGTLGAPAGFTGANEGRTYAKVVIPAMEAGLDAFDGADHLAQWDAYIEAIRTDDPVAAQTASDALTPPLCEYQALLGIAECTGTADEPAPG
jgi:hypothetical protein